MNNKRPDLPVIVLGAGGHAKVLIDLMLHQPIRIIGITERDNIDHYRPVLGIPVIGSDDTILKYPVSDIQLVNGVGSGANLAGRTRVFDYFKNLGYSFAILIHSSALISEYVEVKEGVQVMAGAIIQAGSLLGCNTIINTRVSVDHDCIIGNNVHLAPGVTLSGGVIVGDGTHIGTGATVIQNIHIGRNSLIGAGAVVVGNVPDNTVVMGVPGRVIKYR